MMEKNIAVIGAGYWGKNLVRNFYQLGVLKTICDGVQSIREEIGKTYHDTAITANVSDVLKDNNVKGIVIAAPAALHFEIAEKALQAGKHVFVEKPLSLTHGDGEKLVRLAAERQKTLFVGHILHYHAAVIRLKEMIKAGEIGREENILWSFAPHDISIILSLTGEEPSYVDSVGSNFLHAQIADVTMTNLKFPSGIGAHIFVSWLNPYKEQKLVIVGSNGMLVFDDTEPVETKLVLYPHTIDWKNGLPVPHKAERVSVDLKDIWEEPLKAECKAFLTAIETDTKPITSGEEGLRVLKILERSQRSLEQKENIGTDARLSVMHGNVMKDTSAGVRESERLTEAYPEVFIHPTAVIDSDVEIGKGTKIWHFSHILTGSKIGENCNIGQNVVIGPNAVVGNKCKIQNNVSVYKGVTLEDGVFCGPSMVFTNIYNPRAEISKMDQVRPTFVRKGATLGANCTIVCGHTIGSYAFIGAGAVVTKNVPDHALMVGNPAKKIGWACQCGERLPEKLCCSSCNKAYRKTINEIIEQ